MAISCRPAGKSLFEQTQKVSQAKSDWFGRSAFQSGEEKLDQSLLIR